MTDSDNAELKVMIALIKEARSEGIAELQYKDLRVRFSPQAQQSGSGPLTYQRVPAAPAAASWSTSIPVVPTKE